MKDESEVEILDFKKNIRSNYWFYSLKLNSTLLSKQKIIESLKDNNIQSRPIWGLIPDQIPYKQCTSYKLDKSRYYFENVVNIPCSSNLSKKDVEYVSRVIKDTIKDIHEK